MVHHERLVAAPGGIVAELLHDALYCRVEPVGDRRRMHLGAQQFEQEAVAHHCGRRGHGVQQKDRLDAEPVGAGG